jgi:hypothetical protein
MLKPGLAAPLLDAERLFCPTPKCEVLYYGADGRFARKWDALVRVGVKETEDPVPLCYCFGFARSDIESELARTGGCTIPERITAEIRAGRCACEVKNPSGACCLAEVNKALKDAMLVKKDDMLSVPWLAALVWGVPLLLLVLGGFSGPAVRTALWTAALTVMGGACIVNAARCGRLHCYFTGPAFLLGALASLTYGAGVLPLGGRGWTWISCFVLLSYLVLRWLPERLFGRYTRGDGQA